jgi:hypothetical protein
MSHIRTAIRDNVVTALTGLTTTKANVYPTRIYPLREDKLPGLAVYTLSEDTAYQSINPPRTQNRTLQVVVEAYVKAVSDYDDTMDKITAEIEAALYTDLTRGGRAQDTRVLSFEADISDQGDQPMILGRVTVEVQYATTEGSPTT